MSQPDDLLDVGHADLREAELDGRQLRLDVECGDRSARAVPCTKRLEQRLGGSESSARNSRIGDSCAYDTKSAGSVVSLGGLVRETEREGAAAGSGS